MSYEYKIIINQELPDNILDDITNEINFGKVFHVVNITQKSLCCIYAEEKNNSQLLKWGGSFIINKQDVGALHK